MIIEFPDIRYESCLLDTNLVMTGNDIISSTEASLILEEAIMVIESSNISLKLEGIYIIKFSNERLYSHGTGARRIYCIKMSGKHLINYTLVTRRLNDVLVNGGRPIISYLNEDYKIYMTKENSLCDDFLEDIFLKRVIRDLSKQEFKLNLE